MGTSSRRFFDVLTGAAGALMAGAYYVFELLEYGSLQALYGHMMGTDPLLHILVLSAIPVFAGLGFIMDKRRQALHCYSEDLEMAVQERTSTLHRRTVELQKTLNRHESYIFRVADGLRNPIQVFLGNIERMDTSNFTPEQKETFEDIKDAGEDLKVNVEKLTERRGIKEAEKEPIIHSQEEKI